MLYGTGINKRQSLDVAKALCSIACDSSRRRGIEFSTWIYAASSEDEFDMFTTAVAFRELIARGDLLAYPANDQAQGDVLTEERDAAQGCPWSLRLSRQRLERNALAPRVQAQRLGCLPRVGIVTVSRIWEGAATRDRRGRCTG